MSYSLTWDVTRRPMRVGDEDGHLLAAGYDPKEKNRVNTLLLELDRDTERFYAIRFSIGAVIPLDTRDQKQAREALNAMYQMEKDDE